MLLKHNPKVIENYKAIMLTSALWKLLEKVILHRLTSFLNRKHSRQAYQREFK